MNRPHNRTLIHSAVVLACCTSLSAIAAPEVTEAGRVVRPVHVAHNEQGDVAPMSEPRNGCRQGAPWFSGIGHLTGGSQSEAMGVSADGHYVVGVSTGDLSADQNYAWEHAIAWNACNGIRTLPGTPAAEEWSVARAISNTGRHVAGTVRLNVEMGAMWLNRTDGIEGFLNPRLGLFQHTSSVGVSADGTAFAGTASDADGSEAFIHVLGEPQATMLGDLPGGFAASEASAISHNGNAVVGRSSSANGVEAFLWIQGSGLIGLGDLAGGAFDSNALAVNSDGTVVVGRASTAQGSQAFRWTAETGMIGLGDLPGGAFDSEALAVSADGNVIVGRATSDNGYEAFIWTPESGMRSIRSVAIGQLPQSFALWQLHAARGISADGVVIVGAGVNAEGEDEGWVLELPRGCRADWNADGMLNTSDYFSFLEDFFSGDADFSGDNQTNTQDLFDFLNAFFVGC